MRKIFHNQNHKAMETKFIQTSDDPHRDIQRAAYPGQDPDRMMYRTGYEPFMSMMPILTDSDPMLSAKVDMTRIMYRELASKLSYDGWYSDINPAPETFKRTIIGVERPTHNVFDTIEGREIVVAHWGDGFSSPVHGHARGYIHELLLQGKLRVNTYRLMDTNVVRPVMTRIIDGSGMIASQYTMANPADRFKRQTLIHNFTSIGVSHSLHYVPEHTRDGRDNTFPVIHFREHYPYLDAKLIRVREATRLQPGSVMLVRSRNVPEYGDHFVVITGRNFTERPYGMRQDHVAIHAPHMKLYLDGHHQDDEDVILLELSYSVAQKFHQFHGITIKGDRVEFPNV